NSASEKNVQFLNSRGKVVRSFQVNRSGDTTQKKQFFYLPLSDTVHETSYIKKAIERDCFPTISEVSFWDEHGRTYIIDYFDKSTFRGRLFRKYNSKNKIISEKYYNVIKKEYSFSENKVYSRNAEM